MAREDIRGDQEGNLSKPAIRRLLEGNRRYLANKSEMDISESLRSKVSYKQKPFAVVLGCSDSRVSPEVIFDQNLGALFVVRSAAAIPDRSILQTLEFGVQTFQPQVLVVLGHTKCGGVRYAFESMRGRAEQPDPFPYLVDAVRPSIDGAIREGGDVLDNAIKKHYASVSRQIQESPVVEAAVQEGRLQVVLGWYDIATGVVEMDV